MAEHSEHEDDPVPGHGVVVRAKNGDVIRYDPTGLVMRLADRVIDDIALRLGQPTGAQTYLAATRPDASDTGIPADDALDDIDAWDIRRDGDWLRFTARMPGAQGVRGFRRLVDGGAILGDGPGPVMGILGLGGPRAALATPGAPEFPQHVVAPADDIGAVGHAGVDTAKPVDTLEHLRESTHEALAAQALLGWQMAQFAPLPLFMTRVETDGSANAADLAEGAAVANLIRAAENLKAAAARMGKRAKIAAVCLDYALEDRTGDPLAYRDGMLAVMARVEDALWQLGFDRPLFVARAETALPGAGADHVTQGQWELSWNHGEHQLIFSAPAYAFARNAYDRPTGEARVQMAEMTAAALSAGATWRAPILYLAERTPQDDTVIRVTLQADSDLAIDDALGAGAHGGFSLIGADGDVQIRSVALAPDDPKAVLITCDRPPTGAALRLGYATHGPGALRDGWTLASATGTTLHRWALPASLPITGGTGGA